MIENNKARSSKNKKLLKQAPATSPKKDKQGGTNSNFPQEYEEQLGTQIRMKPQPLVKPK